MKIQIHRGGSSSSKTFSILQSLVTDCLETPELLCSVTRLSLPALKKGVIRDLKNIINSTPRLHRRVRHWKTDNIFEFLDTKSELEVFACDDPQKARGPRRDKLFIDEANELSYETFRQLNMRTRQATILSFNPSDPDIWINRKLEEERMRIEGDVQVVISDYTMNPFLSQQEIREIEYLKPMYDAEGNLIKGDEMFWKIYGLGEYGNFGGAIYHNWHPIDTFFDEDVDDDTRVYAGIDFGYVHDPTAIVLVMKKAGALYVREIGYATGMRVNDIAKILHEHGNPIAYADSSDPRAIDDLRSCGCRVRKAVKGPGSVLQGIQLLQKTPVYYTSDSLNINKEVKRYTWEFDSKTEMYINKPVDVYNHSMDAIRYVAYSKYRTRQGLRVS